jgi:hypothetical protein
LYRAHPMSDDESSSQQNVTVSHPSLGHPWLANKSRWDDEISGALLIRFHEACWWIATGTYTPPGSGPANPFSAVNAEWHDDQSKFHFGKYLLARKQLLNLVVARRVDFFVVISETNHSSVFGVTDNSSVEKRLYKLVLRRDETPQVIEIDDDMADFNPLQPLLRGAELEMLLVDYKALTQCFDFGMPLPAESISQPRMSTVRRGRPPRWDWETILSEIVILANTPDGLPEKQADLEKWVASRCLTLFGEEPASSTIRRKVGYLYQRLRQLGA